MEKNGEVDGELEIKALQQYYRNNTTRLTNYINKPGCVYIIKE